MQKKNDFAPRYDNAELAELNEKDVAAGTSSAACIRWTIRLSKLACPTTAVTKAC